MNTTEIVDGIERAVNFLRNNPTQHITGDLAYTENGAIGKPNDPAASCFCVLGRISNELNLNSYPGNTDNVRVVMEKLELVEDQVYDINDRRPLDEDGLCGISRSNGEVLDFVEGKIKEFRNGKAA